MKYFIKRDLNEYGPYTLTDLQRYVAQGNISPNDLTRSEGMTDWVPVSQVVGNIPPPAPPQAVPVATPAQGGTVYSAAPTAAPAAYGTAAAPTAAVPAAPAVAGPVPPDLHWALVLLIGFFCGLFNLVWVFIEAGFVKKLKPESNHLALIITGVAIQFGSVIVFYIGIIAAAATAANSQSNEPPAAVFVMFGLLVVGSLGGLVVHIIGNFKMRDAMVEYYNTVEPINLRLSGVMTFFFALFYFQYHFSRIAAWKRTGYLVPQIYQG
jgi:hypothetical protein